MTGWKKNWWWEAGFGNPILDPHRSPHFKILPSFTFRTIFVLNVWDILRALFTLSEGLLSGLLQFDKCETIREII